MPERELARRDVHAVRGAAADFDIAILDSQHIGEAVTNGNILDITDFVNENIDVDAYDPYLLAPMASTRKPRRDSATRTPASTACRCSATPGR